MNREDGGRRAGRAARRARRTAKPTPSGPVSTPLKTRFAPLSDGDVAAVHGAALTLLRFTANAADAAVAIRRSRS